MVLIINGNKPNGWNKLLDKVDVVEKREGSMSLVHGFDCFEVMYSLLFCSYNLFIPLIIYY